MRSSRWVRPALTTLLVAGASARAHAACGDGALYAAESCDDANVQDGDGCTASCQLEAGYACSGAPSLCCFEDAASAYALLGDATLAPGIITLTPEEAWKLGTAWYRQPLDFTNPFTISVRLYLGTRDGAGSATDVGADGGALLFQRDPRGLATTGVFTGAAGQDGGELGAKGITPVVGVEFDTYNNGATFGDNTSGDEDHTSVFKDGTNPQRNQLTPAACMNDGTTCANFEDGAWHRFDVSWSGRADHHLRVRVDGVQRIDLGSDLVRDQFGDDPKNIVFGFAANTGGYYNLQRFCPLAPNGFSVPRDRDQDGIDDALDGDSDGDGRSDAEETSSVFGGDPDADGDRDGIPDYRDPDAWALLQRAADCPDVMAPIGACDSFVPAIDFDRDGVVDHLDLDADADGAPDASDGAPRDPCMPVAIEGCPQSMDAGVADASAPDASAPDATVVADAGRPIVEGPTPGDLDGDQVSNEADVAPSDPCKPNRNALACAAGDLDGDALSNEFECPGLRACRDSDGDGVSDYADSDSDGDGIADARECPDASACADSDGDGVVDLLQPAPAKQADGCSLAHGTPSSLLWLALLLFSARTGSSVRCATARACAARRSLPWFRAARRRPRAAPRSS